MTTPPSSDQLVTAIQNVLPDTLAAWVYGSAANGSMNAENDVGVAVLLPFNDVRKTTGSLRNAAQNLADIWGHTNDLVRLSTVSCVLRKRNPGRRAATLYGQAIFNVKNQSGT